MTHLLAVERGAQLASDVLQGQRALGRGHQEVCSLSKFKAQVNCLFVLALRCSADARPCAVHLACPASVHKTWCESGTGSKAAAGSHAAGAPTCRTWRSSEYRGASSPASSAPASTQLSSSFRPCSTCAGNSATSLVVALTCSWSWSLDVRRQQSTPLNMSCLPSSACTSCPC